MKRHTDGLPDRRASSQREAPSQRETPSGMDGYTPLGRRRKRLYLKGDRLVGDVVLDLLGRFKLGPLYVRILRNEGERLMSAVDRFGRFKGAFDSKKKVLKTAFLMRISPCLPVFDVVYETLAEMVFAKVAPLFGYKREATPAPRA